MALDEGLIHPMTLLEDAPRRYAAYAPENFDRGFMGPVFARDALIHSRNVPAATLLEELDVQRFRDWLETAGVDELMSAEHYGLALALGGSEMTMEELVRLYAVLASGGVRRDLAVTPGGGDASPRRLLSAEASFLVLDMLRDVPRPDSLLRSGAARQPIAWKTGTSFGFRDAWSVGVGGPYVLAVWVGNFDGSPNPAFVGRDAAAPLFFAIADSLRIPAPSDRPPAGLNLRRVEVCASTGDLPGPHCPRTTRSWFIPGVSPIKESSVYRAVCIDPSTGLRSCREDVEAVQEVYEFWPSNLQAVFRRAGVSIRPPPPWSPECGLDRMSGLGRGSAYRLAPDLARLPRAAQWVRAVDSALLGGGRRRCEFALLVRQRPVRRPGRGGRGLPLGAPGGAVHGAGGGRPGARRRRLDRGRG